MTTINVEMSAVESCSVESCAYNEDRHCHAKAINVGNGAGPDCDTAYLDASEQGDGYPGQAGVGACASDRCVFNEGLMCAADGITVGPRGAGHVGCLTYQTA